MNEEDKRRLEEALLRLVLERIDKTKKSRVRTLYERGSICPIEAAIGLLQEYESIRLIADE